MSPANGDVCVTTNPVVLDWNGVSDWGENCDGGTNTYRVYVNGVQQGGSLGSGTTSYTFNGTWGSSYTWYVNASNGAESRNSATWSFTLGACARVVGRVQEDVNRNGIIDGLAETWGPNPPPAANCAGLLDNDINFRSPPGGSAILAAWGCNPLSYYMTSYINLGGPPGTTKPVNIQIVTPDAVDWPSRYSSWTYAMCNNVGCSASTPGSGTNTETAGITIGDFNGRDWTNHLQWRVERNYPPYNTTIVTSASADNRTTEAGQPVSVFRAGQAGSFTATMNDTRPNNQYGAARLTVARRPFNPTTRVTSDPYTPLGSNNSCTGLTCSWTQADASVPAGFSIYYPVAEDEIAVSTGTGRVNNRCNGVPGVHNGTVTGWADCDTNHADGYQDEAVVFGDSIPTCPLISGPANLYGYAEGLPYKYPESIGFYNMSINDANAHQVRKFWAPPWSSSVPNFATITDIRINAYGSNSNGWPVMQLWIGNNAASGARTKVAEWTVSSGTAQPYPPATEPSLGTFANVSSIDVVFPNDFGIAGVSDRNLYINYIDITYELAPGGPTAVRRLMPYTEANSGQVYYDRGTTDLTFPYDLTTDWFDGNNYTQVTQAGGSFSGVAAGVMAWTGSMSFPIPLRAGSVTGSYALTGRPTVALPFYDGNNCPALNVNINASPTYTIRGNIYTRNASLASCSLQNVASGRLDAMQLTLVDGTGAPIGFVATTNNALNPSYNYEITGVPVGYRENSPGCPNCYARVCIAPENPDVGVYLSQCSQILPTTDVPTNRTWADPNLCSPPIYTDPTQTSGVISTVDLGLDFYQNEKWSMSIDGDVYSPDVTFDVAFVAGDNFSNTFLNRRVDAAPTTIGGFVFVDDTGVDLGAPLTRTNLSEYGGFALSLNTAGTNFSDKWMGSFTPVFPTHTRVSNNANPVVGPRYRFRADTVYTYNLDQFNTWFTNNPGIVEYDVVDVGGNDLSVIYVIGDFAGGERITISKRLRALSATERIVLVTNLPVDFQEDFGIPHVPWVQVPGGTLTVNSYSGSAPALPTGYLDMIIVSSADIDFNSRYSLDPGLCPLTNGVLPDNCRDLPIMVFGSTISTTGVRLNRDLWHISNSDYPAEIVRYYDRLIPHLSALERTYTDITGYTGLSTFDIQTLYD